MLKKEKKNSFGNISMNGIPTFSLSIKQFFISPKREK
jgi:hypothetical protein